MAILRILLFPFSVFFDVITRVRNHLFDIGQKRSFRFEVMVVSVGNLSVGGSGKSPMVEYLVRLLQQKRRVATLSRGYGRATKGFRIATSADTADTIGDEPYQFFRKFNKGVVVAVGEDRAFAIPNILQHDPSPELIILDDAFQHRHVNPQFSVLLTDYSSPFYKDWILPTGNLRESRKGAHRSDVIVITKCPPEMTAEEFKSIVQRVNTYAPAKPVFFATINYGTPVVFGNLQNVVTDVVLVSGIANSQGLETYVRSRFHLVRHFCYRDHHRYSISDLKSITEFCRQHVAPLTILTTEKDMVKLIDPSLHGMSRLMPWAYVPVVTAFLKNGSDFDSLVLRSVEANENRKNS